MMSINLILKNLASVAIVLGVITGLSSITVAQSIDTVDKDVYQKNERDADGGDFGNIFNPIDMMHRSNLQRSRNGADFAEDTSNNLNKAAEEFKLLQQQRLQAQPTTADPSSEPTSNN
ncbi:MAG TPA: hypothetical protein DCF68_11590 [Cyanothece sp. UBA12306]|nr:hypothetical protein [Cyanothece sp. UBA12306]